MDNENNEVVVENINEAAEVAEEVAETVAETAEAVAEAPAENTAAPSESAPRTDDRGDRYQRNPAQQRQLRQRRKKVCMFCTDGIDHIDYKDTVRLRKCISERAKILPRRVSGTCARHQRQLQVAIKRARHVALLPYISD